MRWRVDELELLRGWLTAAGRADMLANRMGELEAQVRVHGIRIGDIEQRGKALVRENAVLQAHNAKLARDLAELGQTGAVAAKIDETCTL